MMSEHDAGEWTCRSLSVFILAVVVVHTGLLAVQAVVRTGLFTVQAVVLTDLLAV
jgi:cell division septal protein FtsQ